MPANGTAQAGEEAVPTRLHCFIIGCAFSPMSMSIFPLSNSVFWVSVGGQKC